MRSIPPLPTLERVLVRLPNALGDTIMATSALRRLATVLPPDRLHVVGLAAGLQVLEGNPWIGKAFTYDRKGEHRGLGGMRRIARQLREARYDLAISFPNSLGAALMLWLARARHRLGYFKEGRRVLLTAGRPREHDATGKFIPRYTGDYFNALLDLLPDLAPAERSHPQLFLDEAGEAECEAWMREAGLVVGEPFLIVVPGAAFGPSKIWIPDRYAAVADALAREREARVLVSYGPGEEAIAGAVGKHLSSPRLPDARVSLRGLKSIYSRAAFALTNDTGPRHLAVAFDIPNVTIMGPNDPRYTHLDGERGEVVREAVPCSPCQLKACPLAEQVCMTQLTVDRVLERCLANWPR